MNSLERNGGWWQPRHQWAYSYAVTWFLLKFGLVSDGGMGFPEVFLLMAMGFVSAVLLLVLVGRKVWRSIRHRSPAALLGGLHANLLLLILVAGFAQTFYNYPLRVRLFLSLPALQEFRETYKRPPNDYPASGAPYDCVDLRVGLFHVRRVEFTPRGHMELVTADSGLLDSVGIAYRPGWKPMPKKHRVGGLDYVEYDHLFGDWWWFSERS